MENKKYEKDIPIKPTVTNVIDVTNVTDVTDVTNGFVTFVTCYKDLSDTLFGDSTFERILKFLAENKGDFTYDKIAKNINRNEGSVRTSIHRNKDYFLVTKPNGKICNTYLKQMAVDEIKSRIDRLNAEKEEKIRFKKQADLNKIKQDELKEDINLFLKSNKFKRENKDLLIDYEDILIYNPKIAEDLLMNPKQTLKLINNYYENRYNLKLINLPDSININIENLRNEQLNRLISIEGRLISFGEVRPLVTEIEFECPSCGTVMKINQNYIDKHIKNPVGCICGRKSNFRILSKTKINCSFLQLEDLQENTDNPYSKRIKSIILNRLCDKENISMFSPGNEIKAYGILKEVPVIKNGKVSLIPDWILEIVSAELIEKDMDINKFSDEEIKEIKELSKNINNEGLDILLDSFAPEVYGYKSIKGALTLQLCNKRNNYKYSNIKNKSNILLIGDPGVAKSILCNFAIGLTEGGMRAVGGGSSAVGITASVVREEDSIGGFRVEPGAMILAKDLLFIDEMNNLTDEDKPKLQEGMSEQKVSINKANIHCQMKVSCGILASANPKNGHFVNPYGGKIEDQFNIPTPIINRFDTIFVLKDIVDEDNDKKIASKMIKRHRGILNNKYDKGFLKKFFSYIKNFDEPILDDDIEELLKKVYFSARQFNYDGVKINPRFLESLNRMCIASAKLRLSNKVELKDVKVALEIIKDSQYKINTKKILEDL